MNRVGTWIALFFIVAGALTYVVLDNGLTAAWAILGWINTPLLGAQFTTTSAISMAIAAVATVVTWRHPTIQVLSGEVVQELVKVSWPSWLETRANTVVVIVFSFIMAAILGVFDYVFAAISDGFFRASAAF